MGHARGLRGLGWSALSTLFLIFFSAAVWAADPDPEAVVIAPDPTAASAQLAVPLSAGDVAVTGFSGTKLSVESLPPGVNPLDMTVIDGAGISLRIFDLSTLNGPPAGQAVDAPVKLEVPARDIGQVFGMVFDDGGGKDGNGTPNLYAASTSAYGLQIVAVTLGPNGETVRLKQGSPDARFMDGQFGSLPGNSPSAIWKIDGTTGAVTHIADTAFSGVLNSGPGIGNLTFDQKSRNLYASDLDTGLIHRFDLDSNAADLGQFDHGVVGRKSAGLDPVEDDGKRTDLLSSDFKADDPSTWGFTQPERRIGGLAVHDGRLYYAVAEGPEIWSVEIGADGSFGSIARREVAVKADKPFAVTDIAFDAQRRLIVAQRATLKSPFDYGRFVEPSDAQVLRFLPEQPEDPATPDHWVPTPEDYAIGFPEGNTMGSGGIALQRAFGADGTIGDACETTLIATGDDLRNNPALANQAPPGAANLHGIQINDAALVRPANAPPTQSAFTAFDRNQSDPDTRGHIGDVAVVPCGGAGAAAPIVESPPLAPFAPGIETPPVVGFPPVGAPGIETPPIIEPPVITEPPVELPVETPPEQGALQIVKTASVATCSSKGGCAFSISVSNPSAIDVPGPIVIDDQIDAPLATMTGEPNAPWVCTKAPPFNCTHPGPVPAGGALEDMRLVFAPNTPPETKELRNCARQNGVPAGGVNPGNEVPDPLADPNAPPVDPNAPLVVDPNAPPPPPPVVGPPPAPITQTSDKGLSAVVTPVSPDCSATGGNCEWRITLTNTGAATIAGALTLSDQVFFGGDAATTPQKIDIQAQSLPAGFACQPTGAAVQCTSNAFTLAPNASATLGFTLKITVPPGAAASSVVNRVSVKVDGDNFIIATAGIPLTGAAVPQPGGGADGVDAVPGVDEPIPPEQCATIPIQPPEEGGGGGKAEEPSEVNGLRISKTAGPNGADCTENGDCKFSIGIQNTNATEVPGPIVINDTVSDGGGGLFGATAITSGPTPPWTCGKPGQTFTCTHPGPVPAGGSLGFSIGFKIGQGTAATEIKNCAALNGGAVPACATVPLAAPTPAQKLQIKKEATSRMCGESGGCEFKISVANPGPEDFTGPFEFTDVLRDQAGKILLNAEVLQAQAISQPDVLLFPNCVKQGEGFTCSTGQTATKIPAGKTAEIVMSFKPGASPGATEIRNCAAIAGGEGEKCATIPMKKGPLLRATKVTAAPSCVPECAFAIIIQNIGDADAAGPFFFDDIFSPKELIRSFSVIDGEFGCTNKPVCLSNKKVLKPGEVTSGRLIFRANTKPESKIWANCALIRDTESFEVAGDNRGCAVINDSTPPKPNLQVIKRAPNTRADDPDGVGSCGLKGFCRFRIEIKNTGDAPFTGELVVSDSATNGVPVQMVEGAPPGWQCAKPAGGIAGNAATCSRQIVNMPPDTSFFLEAWTSPNALKKNDTFENCASIGVGPDLDSVPDDNKDCATVKVDPFNVQVAKTGDQSCQAGGECHFRIRLFNDGPIDHDAPVTVSDKLSGLAGAQIVSIAPSLTSEKICTTEPTQIPFSCTSPGNVPLKIGDEKVFEMTVRLPESAAAAPFTNCATVEPDAASSGSGSAGDRGPSIARATGGQGPATPPASGTPANACVTVQTTPPEPTPTPTPTPPQTCFSNMVVGPDGRCGCPGEMKWDGRTCQGTGGINPSAQPGDKTPPPVIVPPVIPPVVPPPPTCFSNMVADANGRCSCPGPTKWNGRKCESTGGATPSKQQETPPCPRGTRGTPPNCVPIVTPPVIPPCPAGTFGTPPNCTSGTGGSNTSKQPETPPCPRGTRGTPPNCIKDCPRGTQLRNGVCVTIECPAGTRGTPPNCVRDCTRGTTLRNGVCVSIECPPGTRGTPPNCVKDCPRGTRLQNGVCVQDRCPPGTRGTPPNCVRDCPRGTTLRDGVCVQDRCPPGTRGTPPNCVKDCPRGTTLRDGVCVRDRCPPGTRGTPPNCVKDCPRGTALRDGVCVQDRCPQGMTGVPPTCCPPGTLFRNGRCERPETCKFGMIGTPPNCRCPEGTRLLRRGTQIRCVDIPKCPGNSTGTYPNCSCPAGQRFTGSGCEAAAPAPARECGRGMIGTPPNCQCPPGQRLSRFSRRCVAITAPPPPPPPVDTGPSPKPTGPRCPSGTRGTFPNCEPIVN